MVTTDEAGSNPLSGANRYFQAEPLYIKMTWTHAPWTRTRLGLTSLDLLQHRPTCIQLSLIIHGTSYLILSCMLIKNKNVCIIVILVAQTCRTEPRRSGYPDRPWIQDLNIWEKKCSQTTWIENKPSEYATTTGREYGQKTTAAWCTDVSYISIIIHFYNHMIDDWLKGIFYLWCKKIRLLWKLELQYFHNFLTTHTFVKIKSHFEHAALFLNFTVRYLIFKNKIGPCGYICSIFLSCKSWRWSQTWHNKRHLDIDFYFLFFYCL